MKLAINFKRQLMPVGIEIYQFTKTQTNLLIKHTNKYKYKTNKFK